MKVWLEKLEFKHRGIFITIWLVGCGPLGCKELDMTEQWTLLVFSLLVAEDKYLWNWNDGLKRSYS